MKWEFLGFVGNLIYPTEETFAVNKMETFTIKYFGFFTKKRDG